MKNKPLVQQIGILQSKITLEENLPLAYAAILAENALFRFDPRVREGVYLWMADELNDSFMIEDISIADIQEEIGGSLFQALSVMDIFLKNDEFIPKARWFEERC